MYMVAAAKMRKAQEAILKDRPYALKLDEIMSRVASQVDQQAHPLVRERELERTTVVVIAADRGLCGSFNSNVIRRGADLVDSYGGDRTEVICVGGKSRDFFTSRGYDVAQEYAGIFGDLNYGYAQAITEDLISRYTSARTDRIEIVCNEFKSALVQEVMETRFLPLLPRPPEADPNFVEYLYEPSKESVWDQLVSRHLAAKVWRTLLESNASEQAARMSAMDNATNNADDMIQELTQLRNKVRQTAITSEITEIVGGADALAG